MHLILALHGHGGTPFTMAIIALVAALAMVTLNTQETFAIASVGNAGQGSTGAGGGPYIDPSLFCTTGVTTPICTSSITLSNLLHPRPLINHLSVTLHPTTNISKQHSKITPNNADVAHVSPNTASNVLDPTGDNRGGSRHHTGSSTSSDSRDSSRHHYHNTSAYTGSSTSSDSRDSSRHHYHNTSAYTGSSTSSDSRDSSRHHYQNTQFESYNTAYL